jgi:uncharacterized Zn-binding protein involved in type VI secretion
MSIMRGCSIHGKNVGLHGDKTSSGAQCIAARPGMSVMGLLKLYIGDKTTPCPKCGEVGVIVDGDHRCTNSAAVAVDGAEIRCGCPQGSNFLIAPGTIPQLSKASARMAPVAAPEPEQHAQAAKKKKREITLTLGVFFDGTGNNAINTDNTLKACIAQRYELDDTDASAILGKCAKEGMGVSGVGATSYMGYYTNVHWLQTLYKQTISPGDSAAQKAIYIDGIGTEAGQPDSMIGQGLGISDTGVVAKTDKAVSRLKQALQEALSTIRQYQPDYELVIKSLQFDIFGFSRGAAASRHFANRIHSEDPAIIAAIRDGMQGTEFKGAPAGKIRFIGIFDTVAAIGTPLNGLNPHNANTGNVNLVLRPGVAEKVFHITAAHECRFNFALNSVKPAWPELALPGVHSDIGGGYLPAVEENLFLTRPETDTVPLRQPGQQTRGYHQATKQLEKLDTFPAVAPIMHTSEISVETWFDDRMPPDHYGESQKRSYAAMTLRNRVIKNDWSKVTLRVMYAAAQEAGVMFDEIQEDDDFNLPDELKSLCDKAVAMGKAVRSGQPSGSFSQDEIDTIARQYIHCSANWNAIIADTKGFTQGGASPAEIVGFLDRPDENWLRTVYSMDGKKV